MDHNEFEIKSSKVNTDVTYSEEVEYLVKELNSFAHAGGRYSRSVQLPIAIKIINQLNELKSK